ncbi:MAG: coenzyme F420-0:L-glutamate ligase [Chloroflexi bacterium]|nr:MAG: coenzyme F420-0:L-glutamate ligase [Chloroflexota bacterium]
MNTKLLSIEIIALPGIPLIKAGDDLVQIILDGLQRAELTLQEHDTLVIASKIVSKAEGRLVDLKTVTPGEKAHDLAEKTRKDARIVELVLRESEQISRYAPGVLIVQHRLGFTCANAGIDQSNVDDREDCVLLLPYDPDKTASELHQRLFERTGTKVGIVISDSHGRPFRMGNTGVAIGVAGMPALVDLRGQSDLFGRELEISMQGYADLVASAAHLLSGEGDEGRPVILLRGLQHPNGRNRAGRASDLNRAAKHDLYR